MTDDAHQILELTAEIRILRERIRVLTDTLCDIITLAKEGTRLDIIQAAKTTLGSPSPIEEEP